MELPLEETVRSGAGDEPLPFVKLSFKIDAYFVVEQLPAAFR